MRQFLHVYVLKLAGKYYPRVVFANGDCTDCRLINLKVYEPFTDSTRSPNKASSSRFKGVSFHRRRGKWQVCMRVRSRIFHLGYFDDPEEASKVYVKHWNLAHPNRKPLIEHELPGNAD